MWVWGEVRAMMAVSRYLVSSGWLVCECVVTLGLH